MARITFMLLMLFAGMATVCAEKLQVLSIGKGVVKVGDVPLKQGMVFDGKSPIEWDKAMDNQIIKVVGKTSHKVYVISSKVMNINKQRSIEQMLVKKQALASREGILLNDQSLRMFFNRNIALLSSFSMETSYVLNDTHFFFLQYLGNEGEIHKKLPFEGQHIFFNDEIFKLDGKQQSPCTRSYKLYYYNEANGDLCLIADKLVLSVDMRNECRQFMETVGVTSCSLEEWVEVLGDFCAAKYPAIAFEKEDIECFCNQIFDI